MTNTKPKILFFSTGDSTRSRMAAGFYRAFGSDDLDVVNTAVKSEELHARTNEIMRETGVDISGIFSESITESFREKGRFECVITISDGTIERHPVFPFTAHMVPLALAGSAMLQ